MPAVPAGDEGGIPSAVDEQHRLLAFFEALAEVLREFAAEDAVVRVGSSRITRRGCEKIGTGTSQPLKILGKQVTPFGASPIFSQPLCVLPTS